MEMLLHVQIYTLFVALFELFTALFINIRIYTYRYILCLLPSLNSSRRSKSQQRQLHQKNLRQNPRKIVMAPKKEKAPPSSKPAKSGGGKQKKKKWSKGKQKEKVNNMVLFDKATYDKLLSEASKYKLVTPSILSDRLRINGSLARKAIKELMARGSIRMVSAHASQQIYTRATNTQ
ncbi:unnamed protein product [Camellia sinensis]